jgi:hypothetical protein
MVVHGTRVVAPGVVLLMLLWCLPSGGCAARGPVFSPVVAPGDDGVVYVYRRGAVLEGRDVKIFIDAEYVGRLGAGEYVARVVAPGERLIRAERKRELVVAAPVARGESVFYEVKIGAFQARPELTQRLPEEALPWISKLHQGPGVQIRGSESGG